MAEEQTVAIYVEFVIRADNARDAEKILDELVKQDDERLIQYLVDE